MLLDTNKGIIDFKEKKIFLVLEIYCYALA